MFHLSMKANLHLVYHQLTLGAWIRFRSCPRHVTIIHTSWRARAIFNVPSIPVSLVEEILCD